VSPIAADVGNVSVTAPPLVSTNQPSPLEETKSALETCQRILPAGSHDPLEPYTSKLALSEL